MSGAKPRASESFGVTSVAPSTGAGPRGCGSQTSGAPARRSACRSPSDPAAVVGDEQRVGPFDRRARRGRRRADGAGRHPAAVDAQQRPAARAHADLLRRRPVQPEVDHLDALGLQRRRELAAGGVGRERGDEPYVVADGGGQRGGQAGAAGAHRGVIVLDDRHRGVRRQPRHVALDVPVQQRVADDREPQPRAHA
jgi:hypothetical protein